MIKSVSRMMNSARLWRNVPHDEKRYYTTYGCLNYPEVFGGDYDRYSLWLTSQGVVDSHTRDQFSSGGKEPMLMSDGKIIEFPGVYRRIKHNRDYFIRLASIQSNIQMETTPTRSSELGQKLLAWASAASKASGIDYDASMDALSVIFFGSSPEAQINTR